VSFDLGAWGPGALEVKGPSLQGTKVSRYNGTVPVGFFGLAISFFKKNIRKQFYRTALGNCYGLKLPNSRLQFKSVHFRSLYIVGFTMASSASYQTVGEQRHADTTFSVECGVGVVALDARMRRREDDARD